MGDGLNIDEEMGNCLDDITDSEINQYKEVIYKLLKFRTCKIKGPNGELRCPFCVGVENQEYHRLLEHSIRVGEGSTESGKQRASHFAMAKYLVIDLPCQDKTKRDLRNNEMAEKLREAEENYRGLIESLKENEVALSTLAEKNSMLEFELAQAKEDATSTVEKLQEVENTCLQLQRNLQSMEDKMSNLEDENSVLRLKDESPFPSKLLGGFSNCRRTKLGIEKHQAKEVALSNLEDAYQHSKERQSNDELQEIRLELITLLSDLASCSYADYSFGVKRMGGIDEKALKEACKKRFPSSIARSKLAELHFLANTIYEAYVIIEDDKGNPQGLLIRSEQKLQGLKAELGEEIYNVLLASLFERQKYSRSGSYMKPELWNFGENRKATLKEIIRYIFSLLKTQNQEREPSMWKRWAYGVF